MKPSIISRYLISSKFNRTQNHRELNILVIYCHDNAIQMNLKHFSVSKQCIILKLHTKVVIYMCVFTEYIVTFVTILT